MNAPLAGPFIKGGVCATLAWWIIWPFETLKSQVQGNTAGPTGAWSRLGQIARTGGVQALFRGIVPGSARSMIANGCSMTVFMSCQSLRKSYLEDTDSEEKSEDSKL